MGRTGWSRQRSQTSHPGCRRGCGERWGGLWRALGGAVAAAVVAVAAAGWAGERRREAEVTICPLGLQL